MRVSGAMIIGNNFHLDQLDRLGCDMMQDTAILILATAQWQIEQSSEVAARSGVRALPCRVSSITGWCENTGLGPRGATSGYSLATLSGTLSG